MKEMKEMKEWGMLILILAFITIIAVYFFPFIEGNVFLSDWSRSERLLFLILMLTMRPFCINRDD